MDGGEVEGAAPELGVLVDAQFHFLYFHKFYLLIIIFFYFFREVGQRSKGGKKSYYGVSAVLGGTCSQAIKVLRSNYELVKKAATLIVFVACHTFMLRTSASVTYFYCTIIRERARILSLNVLLFIIILGRGWLLSRVELLLLLFCLRVVPVRTMFISCCE